MESINTFSAGQNSDLSKQNLAKDTYLQAYNFRPLTELGASNGSLVNIKGNECNITFPDLQAVYKLILKPGLVETNTNNVSITINGFTYGVALTLSNTTSVYTIYKYIVDNYTECYQNTTVANKTFSIVYNLEGIIIYQQPIYLGCSPVASIPTIISNSYTQSTAGDYPVLNFVNTGDVASLTQNTNSPYVKNVSSAIGLIPIGSTFILDDIYILTAPNDLTFNINVPSNDSFGSVGTIWKLNIDDVTKDGTLTLIYSNNLDLSKFHPIAPSAILGRYESNNIQRIYWTDFYNKIRNLNVGDPDVMGVSPALLNVFPSISFEIPFINTVIAGSLNCGTWELCYRLKKVTGAITNFSQTSNLVHLINQDPNDYSTTNFVAYQNDGSLGNSGRGIRWNVQNIDISYDTIEYVVLYRASKTEIPIVYVKPEELITATNVTVDITTITGFDTIELEEFLTISAGFTHAKTVDTKDNRLFWGNVKYEAQGDISALFDARAFRSLTPTSGTSTDIKLKNNGVIQSYTLTNAEALPNTSDAINPYYDNNGDETGDACFYQPGSTELGGRGKFISYTFGTEEIKLSDTTATEGPSGYWHIDPTLPFSNTGGIAGITTPQDLITTVGSDSDNQLYTIQGVSSTKNPYVTSLLKGYQHEEIYRMGIQFFDLQGNPFFTEWVGDIKMPKHSDTNSNPGPLAQLAGVTDFRNSFLYNGDIYGQIMHIKFTVDVTTVKDIVSGYQIVRVERTQENKTILGNGMLTNSFSEGSKVCLGGGLYRNTGTPFPNLLGVVFGNQYNPYPTQDSLETLGHSSTANYVSKRVLTFDCFDFISDSGGYSHNSGDKILIRSKVRPINRQNAHSGLPNPRYRKGFTDLSQWITNNDTQGTAPSKIDPFLNGGVGKFQTGFDSDEMPFYILHYVDSQTYTSSALTNKTVDTGDLIAGNGTQSVLGSLTFENRMACFNNDDGSYPGYGSFTTLLTFDFANEINGISDFNTTEFNGEKLMALYYRPNTNQYGGNTYSARTTNSYIACGSFIPITRLNKVLTNNLILDFKCFGGDIHLNYWDHQKIVKNLTNGTTFRKYVYDTVASNSPGSTLGNTNAVEFNISNTYNIPCTNSLNQGVRFGIHIDHDLNTSTYALEDEYFCETYHSNEKNVVKFFAKPLNFQTNDVWRARVFYSEVKFDNEIDDSWSIYGPTNFYDVEGSYGQINALVSLKENMYYFQERGVGILMINPVSVVNDSLGQNIQLGAGTKVIQKHYYRAIDMGTSHQWSVYRSQGSISFVDVRHKKIYLFNGESVSPISDLKGQRNFIIKRLHNTLLGNDNPVINKGILTTYDYYHNEFLYTFNNVDSDDTQDENVTLAYSEITGAFSGMYSFSPNLYINNNKYLLSTLEPGSPVVPNKLWLHNYGQYSNFYDTLYPSMLKVLVNDNPLYTKVFDNLSLMTDTINDNIEWSDDLNLYPGSITNPSYPDDVNYKDVTFDRLRAYNDYQNTDWVTLSTVTPNNNLRRVERTFNLQLPRNKFNYDTNNPSTYSIFDPSRLTKTTFGERMRDKWLNIDLSFSNNLNLRFVIHNIKTLFRISDR